MVVRAQQGIAAIAVAWAVLAALGALRAAWALPPDPIDRLEREFSRLANHLPPSGQIGYLEHYEEAGAEDATRTYYAAQYALVPRVLVARVGLEYMIVAQGTARPDREPRLDGYFLVSVTPEDHRVYRRLAP
jgi:hypothetical protein